MARPSVQLVRCLDQGDQPHWQPREVHNRKPAHCCERKPHRAHGRHLSPGKTVSPTAKDRDPGFSAHLSHTRCPLWSLKLFSDGGDSFALDSTQVSVRAAQVGSSSHGTPTKRRRIQLGWEVLRDHLQPQNSDFDIIPWYENHITGK